MARAHSALRRPHPPPLAHHHDRHCRHGHACHLCSQPPPTPQPRRSHRSPTRFAGCVTSATTRQRQQHCSVQVRQRNDFDTCSDDTVCCILRTSSAKAKTGQRPLAELPSTMASRPAAPNKLFCTGKVRPLQNDALEIRLFEPRPSSA